MHPLKAYLYRETWGLQRYKLFFLIFAQNMDCGWLLDSIKLQRYAFFMNDQYIQTYKLHYLDSNTRLKITSDAITSIVSMMFGILNV